MSVARVWLALFLVCAAFGPSAAIEGPSGAGPIGGTDVRSAFVPPPGLYGGGIVLGAATTDFVDRQGNTIPVLKDAYLAEEIAGPLLVWVPDMKVLGGSIGVGAIIPIGNICGRLFTGTSQQCKAGVGDLYVEADWSRFFGNLRASNYPNAYPIPEGLAVMLGFGVVFPTGKFDHSDPASQAVSIGANIWDFAPSIAFTYTTAPILAEGTELSVKLYWNNYLGGDADHAC